MKEFDDYLKSSSAVMASMITMQADAEIKENRRREAEQYKTTAPIHGLSYQGIAYCEAKGLSKVFAAYAENASGETIESVGFNPNSGYVYIALENGIQLCSMLGQDVEYLVTNFDDGEEVFFDSYDDALSHDWNNEEEGDEDEDDNLHD